MNIKPHFDTLVETLFMKVDLLLDNYIYNGYHALVSYLKVPLGLAIIIYVIISGYAVANGLVHYRWSDLSKQAFRIGLIYTFALHWDIFSLYVVDLMSGASQGIAATMLKATPLSIPDIPGIGFKEALQGVLSAFIKLGNIAFGQSSWTNLTPLITGLLIDGFGFTLIALSILEVLLAKLMLALSLTMAPLFVSLTLFKPMQSIFDRWLGAMIGSGLVLIFVSSILGFALTLADWSIADLYLQDSLHIAFIDVVPAVIVSFLCIGLVLKASSLAQGIGGVVTTSSASIMLAGSVGSAVFGGLGTLNKAKDASGRVFGLSKSSYAAAKTVAEKTQSMIKSFRERLSQ